MATTKSQGKGRKASKRSAQQVRRSSTTKSTSVNSSAYTRNWSSCSYGPSTRACKVMRLFEGRDGAGKGVT